MERVRQGDQAARDAAARMAGLVTVALEYAREQRDALLKKLEREKLEREKRSVSEALDQPTTLLREWGPRFFGPSSVSRTGRMLRESVAEARAGKHVLFACRDNASAGELFGLALLHAPSTAVRRVDRADRRIDFVGGGSLVFRADVPHEVVGAGPIVSAPAGALRDHPTPWASVAIGFDPSTVRDRAQAREVLEVQARNAVDVLLNHVYGPGHEFRWQGGS